MLIQTKKELVAHVELGTHDTYFQFAMVYTIDPVLSNTISIPDCLNDLAVHAWWTVVRCLGDVLRMIVNIPKREVLSESDRRAKVRASTYLGMPHQLMSLIASTSFVRVPASSLKFRDAAFSLGVSTCSYFFLLWPLNVLQETFAILKRYSGSRSRVLCSRSFSTGGRKARLAIALLSAVHVRPLPFPPLSLYLT